MGNRLQVDLRGRCEGRSDQRVHRGDGPGSARGALHAEAERTDDKGGRSSGDASRRKRSDEESVSHSQTGAPRHDLFRQFSHLTSTSVGKPWAFAVACGVVLVWAATGPLFHFSDTWQLVINTGTTIITFLMVFLIQNTQNRDAIAIHLKLDELICALKGARNQLVDIEELSDEELEKLRLEFRRLGAGTVLSHPHVRDKDS